MYAWSQSGLPNRQNNLIEFVAYIFGLAHARIELASIQFKIYGRNYALHYYIKSRVYKDTKINTRDNFNVASFNNGLNFVSDRFILRCS